MSRGHIAQGTELLEGTTPSSRQGRLGVPRLAMDDSEAEGVPRRWPWWKGGASGEEEGEAAGYQG